VEREKAYRGSRSSGWCRERRGAKAAGVIKRRKGEKWRPRSPPLHPLGSARWWRREEEIDILTSAGQGADRKCEGKKRKKGNVASVSATMRPSLRRKEKKTRGSRTFALRSRASSRKKKKRVGGGKKRAPSETSRLRARRAQGGRKGRGAQRHVLVAAGREKGAIAGGEKEEGPSLSFSLVGARLPTRGEKRKKAAARRPCHATS